MRARVAWHSSFIICVVEGQRVRGRGCQPSRALPQGEGEGMRVTCDVEEVTLTNDEGLDVESVEATCSKVRAHDRVVWHG